jgi:hypothetical protein
MDVGAPISYEVLEKGTSVISRDGQEVGKVEHVLAAEDEDIFDGIGDRCRPRTGRTPLRRRGAGRVDQRAGRDPTLDAEACQRLPEPSANPAVMQADPSWGDTVDERMLEKLRRAWDLLSGNY